MTAVATKRSPRSPPTQLPSPQVTSIEPSSLPLSVLSKQINSQQELPILKDLQSYKTNITGCFKNFKFNELYYLRSSTQDSLAPLWLSSITQTYCAWIRTWDIVVSTSNCSPSNILTAFPKYTKLIILGAISIPNYEPFTRHSEAVLCVCVWWWKPQKFPQNKLCVFYLAKSRWEWGRLCFPECHFLKVLKQRLVSGTWLWKAR